MKILIFIYWIAAIVTGISCLTVASIHLYIARWKSGPGLVYLLLSLLLSIGILFYMEIISFDGIPSKLARTMIFISGAFTCDAIMLYIIQLGLFLKVKQWHFFRLILLIIIVAILVFHCIDNPLIIIPELIVALIHSVVIVSCFFWFWNRPEYRLPRILNALFPIILATDSIRTVFTQFPNISNHFIFLPAYYILFNILFFIIHIRLLEVSLDFKKVNILQQPLALRSNDLKYGISDREMEVALFLMKGNTYREIAEKMCISLSTVKTHTIHLYQKTEARNRVELLCKLQQ